MEKNKKRDLMRQDKLIVCDLSGSCLVGWSFPSYPTEQGYRRNGHDNSFLKPFSRRLSLALWSVALRVWIYLSGVLR